VTNVNGRAGARGVDAVAPADATIVARRCVVLPENPMPSPACPRTSLPAALARLALALALPLVVAACGGGDNAPPQTLTIAQDDPAYPDEAGLRVGYLLKTWEYERDGLTLDRIEVLDADRGVPLATLAPGTDAMPKRYQDPLPASGVPQSGPLAAYYFPIQVSVAGTLPSRIAHRLVLHGPATAAVTVVEGAAFAPRSAPAPVVVASPLRGRNLMLMNQGTSA
jgi:hypothetical protein